MFRRVMTVLMWAMAQVSAATPEALSLASKTEDEFDASFSWEANGLVASVSARGVLALSGLATAKRQRPTQFPLDKDEWISRLMVIERGDSVFFAFDTESGGYGRGVLCRVATKSGAIHWCRNVPGYNIFAAIANDGAIFVGAIGLLARVDPKTGIFRWKQSGLYSKDKTFNIFCAPEEQGEWISMYGTAGVPSSIGKRIVLNRQSGKIISITEAKLSGGCR